jgi:hypothetical protein
MRAHVEDGRDSILERSDCERSDRMGSMLT